MFNGGLRNEGHPVSLSLSPCLHRVLFPPGSGSSARRSIVSRCAGRTQSLWCAHIDSQRPPSLDSRAPKFAFFPASAFPASASRAVRRCWTATHRPSVTVTAVLQWLFHCRSVTMHFFPSSPCHKAEAVSKQHNAGPI